MIDTITSVAMNHPDDILLWTHGFLAALALRRGRIEAIIGRILPSKDDNK
jgi:hypothetical protein